MNRIFVSKTSFKLASYQVTNAVRVLTSGHDVESIIEDTLAVPSSKKTPPSGPRLLTTRREALSLYREVLRCSRLFTFPDQNGDLWSVKLRESVRKEYEEARFERDPEVINRLLVTGRDALQQLIQKLVEKHSELKRVKFSPGRDWNGKRYFRVVRSGPIRRRILVRSRSDNFDFEEFEAAIGPEIDVPGFDEMVLDDAFYEKVGESKEDIERNPPWSPYATDPEGYNLGFEDYLERRKDIPNYVKTELTEAQYYGNPVILVAGFRLEELPVIRIMIDSILNKDIKLIPIRGQEMLNKRVEEILDFPETDWEQPRDENIKSGGTWGSVRTVVFGGLPMEAQGALIEVMEESGLPPVCVTFISEKTKSMLLGELLVDAIRVQRDRKNPEKQLWDIEGRTVDDVSQLSAFMNEKMKQRVETVAEGLKTGEAQFKESEDGTLRVEMEGLEDQIFDPETLFNNSPVPGPPKEPNPVKEANPVEASKAPEVIRKRIEDSDGQNDRILESEEQETPILDSAFDQKESLEDYFAVDALISDELDDPKPEEAPKQKPQRPSFSTPLRNRKNSTEEDQSKDQSKTHYLTTPPEQIGDNVKRSTVFSGLVSDSGKFLKDNFGYSLQKRDLTPSERPPVNGDSDYEFVEITNSAEQEAFAAEFTEEEEPTLEEVLQDAVARGVDPDYLKQLIEAASGGSRLNRPKEDRPQF